MEHKKLFIIIILFVSMMGFNNCGPVIISSRPSHPTPHWFYPNRVVNVRYIYFPEYTIYYDLTLRKYIYLNNGSWLTVNILPSRFNTINFRHTRQIRVDNYFGDNIRDYHGNKSSNIKGRRTTTDK